jgi:hypothetical protein
MDAWMIGLTCAFFIAFLAICAGVFNGFFSISPAAAPTVKIVDNRIAPFTNPRGEKLQMIYVDWKNTGKSEVRRVKADFIFYDENGLRLRDFDMLDWTIYVVPLASEPGIASGETYREPDGRGVVVPPRLSVSRVEVRNIQAFSFGG